tara:strand:+ start:230 stop:823 length:594 start_codon:yes stop_codon:yes gene_type:complete
MKILTLLTMLLVNAFSQAEVNADIASRYIWRGLASGDAPVIQPSIQYSKFGLNIGAWASYSISSAEKSNVENDFFLSTSIGGLDITFTDYYFPISGELFTMDTHIFELTLNYSYLVDLTLATNIYNDDQYSTYMQIAKEIDGLTLFVGGVAYKSEYYGTKEPAIIEIGASASKGDFSVSYVLNPNDKKNYITLIYSL